MSLTSPYRVIEVLDFPSLHFFHAIMHACYLKPTNYWSSKLLGNEKREYTFAGGNLLPFFIFGCILNFKMIEIRVVDSRKTGLGKNM